MESMSSILSEKSFENTPLSSHSKIEKNSTLFSRKTIQQESGLLEHVLFSLKHEKHNLFVLSLALRHINKEDMLEAITKNPNSIFIRKAALLWEHSNQDEIQIPDNTVSARYIDFFNEEQYITGDDKKHPKWRVNFNGIGSLDWCPVILKTENLNKYIEQDIFKEILEFTKKTDKKILDRAMSWAYLSETKGSFAIENEKPSHNKAEAFISLLKKSKLGEVISEKYLCELQNEVISNPFDKAVFYRHTQNWLQRGGSSASSVTYVPPSPELTKSIMKEIESLSNNGSGINPICLASSISFGFVFAHPFTDGNGRISRFLIHHALNKSDKMPDNIMLPISVAMKSNEGEYLTSLESFSIPARKLCDVNWIDNEDFIFNWKDGSDLFFKYPDLTEQTVFLMEMTNIALKEVLDSEIDFLTMFDKVYSKVSLEHDVNNNALSSFIASALKNKGVISNRKRKRFAYQASDEAMDYIDKIATSELASLNYEKAELYYNEHHELSSELESQLEFWVDRLDCLDIDNEVYESSCGLLQKANRSQDVIQSVMV
jgi:hypothetical protein